MLTNENYTSSNKSTISYHNSVRINVNLREKNRNFIVIFRNYALSFFYGAFAP